MSATASGESWSGRLSRAPARREPACSCRPRRLSTAAQARESFARSTWEPSGTIASPSRRAAWLSAKRPTAVSAPERSRRSSMRSSTAACGRRRSASANHCAALAGARRTASSPASRSTATASASPSRAERCTWCARAAAVAPRLASACAHRSCAPSRQPAGVVSYTARRTSGWRKRKRRGTSVSRTRSSRRSSSTASIASASDASAAAAASSGSNGSPATAAPPNTRRALSDRSASSSFSDAATADGTSIPVSATWGLRLEARSPVSDRDSCSR